MRKFNMAILSLLATMELPYKMPSRKEMSGSLFVQKNNYYRLPSYGNRSITATKYIKISKKYPKPTPTDT